MGGRLPSGPSSSSAPPFSTGVSVFHQKKQKKKYSTRGTTGRSLATVTVTAELGGLAAKSVTEPFKFP